MTQISEGKARRVKQRDVRPLARLTPFIVAHKLVASLAVLFMVLSTTMTLSLTVAARLVIDRGFGHTSPALLDRYFGVLLLIAVLLATFTALRVYFVNRIGERIVADLRKSLYAHVLTLDQSYFLRIRTGEVLSRMANAQDRFADAVGYAGESLDQLETVQAFGRERNAAAWFAVSVETAFSASLERLRARALLPLFVMLFIFCGVAGVLWIGVQDVRTGTLSGGALFQFVILSVLAAGAVGALGETWGEVQKAAGAMERISELLSARPKVAPPARPVPLPSPPRGEVAFDDVRFHYPGRDDLPALNGFSLRVEPGEVVALVGPSGAGKSTVLRLLLRFYDPQAGAVRIDGVDLRDADPADARSRLALVAQDAALFSTSALDNIRFGREEATDAEVRAAARAAEAETFVDALPQGFAGSLGERGRTLSGGQRQRLAIARALVRNAPILLLDEATSALDAQSERLVQQALYDAMRGRTTVVIAHRLATVLRADRIVVMDGGRVVEEGRHADLVAKDGLYAKLARLQFDTAAKVD